MEALGRCRGGLRTVYAESNSRDTGWWMSLVTAPEAMSYLFQLKLNKAVIFDGSMGVAVDPHQHLRSTFYVCM